MLDKLKVLRKQEGISQKTLADAIGVSQQSINKYENHNIEPDIATLIRLADYFDTSIDYLVGHTEIRHKIEPVCFCELNSVEDNVLRGYRKLNHRQKQSVDLIIEIYNEERGK